MPPAGEVTYDAPSPPAPLTKFEAIPDEMSPSEVLAQAQAAAREARLRLNARRDEQKMGFLRERDGSTVLNILVQGDGVIEGTKERPVSLGLLTGKLAEGRRILFKKFVLTSVIGWLSILFSLK